MTLAFQPFADLWNEEPKGCRACALDEPCEAITKLRVDEIQRFEVLGRFNTERNRKRFAGVKHAIRDHLGLGRR